MDEGKILLCDLSKGKIGEDESNFFELLVIAKLQLVALGRARIPEVARRDFFLYLACEIKAIDTRKYILSSGKLDEIGRQLGGWKKQPQK